MREFSIIAQYFQHLTTQHAAVGIGDDCAVIEPPAQRQLVACVDTLVAGRHFPLDTSPHAVGWKSVAVNLSDLAAMGAEAHSILLALSLPQPDNEWLQAFSQGMAECCRTYGVQLLGGDTTQSPTLTVSVTALGWIEPQKAVLRSGAQVGDMIAVSGNIGSAAYALNYPQSGLQNALDYPQPQLALGQILKDCASSMIDISDGLAQDLGHILNASQVGATLYLEKIPVDDALKNLPFDERMQYVLAGGDDYQLCFTISAENFKKLQQYCPQPIYAIGEIQAQSGCRYLYQQQPFQPKTLGYQHFASSEN